MSWNYLVQLDWFDELPVQKSVFPYFFIPGTSRFPLSAFCLPRSPCRTFILAPWPNYHTDSIFDVAFQFPLWKVSTATHIVYSIQSEIASWRCLNSLRSTSGRYCLSTGSYLVRLGIGPHSEAVWVDWTTFSGQPASRRSEEQQSS